MKGFDRSSLPAELKHDSQLFLNRHEAYRIRRSAGRTDVARLEARTDASTNGICRWLDDDGPFLAVVNASSVYRETVKDTAGMKPKVAKRRKRDDAWEALLQALAMISRPG